MEEEEEEEEEEDKVGRTTKAAYAETATRTSPTSQRTITSAYHASMRLKEVKEEEEVEHQEEEEVEHEEEEEEEEEDNVGRTTENAYAKTATRTSPTSQRTITSANHATMGLKKGKCGNARSENMLTWTNNFW